MGKGLLYGTIAFIVPFLYLFRYIIPNEPFSRMIGNDFSILYYNYKVYLLDALSHYRIPLWSPSEAGGFPFYSNPFTQTFYPLNIPLIAFYKVFGGYSYFDHQVFTVLGIGLFSLGTYLWLRSLNVKSEAALFAVIIAGTSLKITEIVRFPNAVHTIAWLPFILWGCTLAIKERAHYKGGFVVFLSTVMMLTGGYLYYVYYSFFFLIFPYILLLLIPKTNKALIPDFPVNVKTYLITTVVSFFSAFAVCFPYLRKIMQLMSQTVDRGGGNYEYAIFHAFTLTDTLGSLFFPPVAQMEGWYYFGMIALLIIIFYILSVISSESESSHEATHLWIILIWFAVITYITWGDSSYLFKALWHYLPGFSNLRVWGRMNIILLPLLALLLAKSYIRFERDVLEPPKRSFRLFLIAFASCYLNIWLAQQYFFSHQAFNDYWRRYFLPSVGNIFDERVFINFGLLGFVLLSAMLVWSNMTTHRSRHIFNGCVVVLLVLNICDTGVVATTQWSTEINPPTARKNLDVDRIDFDALSTKRKYQNNTISLDSEFDVGIVSNWYFNRYVDFLKKYGASIDNFDIQTKSHDFVQLLGINDGQRFYFSKSISPAGISDFLQDARSHSVSSGLEMHIKKYNGDDLQIIVQANEGGYFSFLDNWDSDWTAKVNGQDVAIEKLFGTFKSIKVEKGLNNIEFVYNPLRWKSGS
jgi:hypothetical protein